MLDWHIIEPSQSEYSSPLLVYKADNSNRLVSHAREIIKIIVPIRTHPENLDELLQRFYGTQFLSSIYLRSSYWQILLDNE